MKKLTCFLLICAVIVAFLSFGGAIPPYTTIYIRTVLDDLDAPTARDTLILGDDDDVTFGTVTLQSYLDSLLLETGDLFLLETGDHLSLEASPYENAILWLDPTGLISPDTNFTWDTDTSTMAVTGVANIGDGGTTNYTNIAADGELGLNGDARVTVDKYITASGIRSPGGNPAAFVEYGIAGAWEFDDQGVEANQESISGTLKLPTQMDKTVVPIFKIGWSANGVSPGICEWQLEYLYRSPGEDTAAAAQETLDTGVTGVASATSDGLVITAFSGVDLPSATDQAMFFRVTRLSALGDDTIAGTVELRGMLFTHTRNKLGTGL